MSIDWLLTQLADSFSGSLRVAEPMSKHTTWRIGGPADLLAIPANERDLLSLFSYCQEIGLPWQIIGRGSNLLVKDGGIRGVVIKIDRSLGKITWLPNGLYAQAGISFMSLAQKSVEHGFTGLEWACGIPGNLGGAVIMNAGAYKAQLSDYVTKIDVLEYTGCKKEVMASDIDFSYRKSNLVGKPLAILGVSLQLKPGNFVEGREKMRQLCAIRRDKQPLEYPSAGSVFKNPPNDFAGRLIEAAGCKGLTVGGAQVSTKHANFIVNIGHAQANDVITLMAMVQDRVEKMSGIVLEPEVHVIGE